MHQPIQRVSEPFLAVHEHLDWHSGLHTYIFLVKQGEKRDSTRSVSMFPCWTSLGRIVPTSPKGFLAANMECDERGKSILLAHVQFRFTSCVPSANWPGTLCSITWIISRRSWMGLDLGATLLFTALQLGSVPLVTVLGPDTEPVFNLSRFSEQWLMLFLSSLDLSTLCCLLFFSHEYTNLFFSGHLSVPFCDGKRLLFKVCCYYSFFNTFRHGLLLFSIAGFFGLFGGFWLLPPGLCVLQYHSQSCIWRNSANFSYPVLHYSISMSC